MNRNRLLSDIKRLSCVYPVAVDDNLESLIIRDFNLPPGYNCNYVSVLLMLPSDYPESPPGTGDSKVYLPNGLLFKGEIPADYHENNGPDDDWAWWCYEDIEWDLCKDDLITFFELLRAHMTNPEDDDWNPINTLINLDNYQPPISPLINFQDDLLHSIYQHTNSEKNMQYLNYRLTDVGNSDLNLFESLFRKRDEL
ncbi:MAG: hypothetical protein K9M75_05590 [Phycisphaerae bacterium]|nr:hypothetical protein [Phycisphaerae bacterium]